jgi:hypothetical protein
MTGIPRFNHVALTLPAEALDERGRAELLDFYGEVFGWTPMPTLSRDRELLVLRCGSNEQFVYLHAAAEPMRCGAEEHVGMSVATRAELDALWERAAKRRAHDPRVELTERTSEDFRVLKLHAFYVRFGLPVSFEVQCFEWAPGFGDQSLPEA